MSSRLRSHDPRDVPAAVGGYANAIEVAAGQRLVFVSGQIPETVGGVVPNDPETQCRLIWLHIESCLEAAGMRLTDLAKVTTYLSTRDLAAVNSRVRQEFLGDHRPALTVIIAEIFDSEWMLEIEAVAAAAAAAADPPV